MLHVSTRCERCRSLLLKETTSAGLIGEVVHWLEQYRCPCCSYRWDAQIWLNRELCQHHPLVRENKPSRRWMASHGVTR
jgi:hypothetical protein